MERITIFHGSDHDITTPQFGLGEVHNDYGQAFYCTFDLDMAKEWANKNMIGGIVNKYSLDCRGLKILDLTEKKYNSLNWIAILMHYRKLSSLQKESYRTRLEFLEKQFFIDLSQYDVVIGYRADDAYFKFPMFFIQNELSVERLEEIYHLGNLGKQIAIISEKAFGRIEATAGAVFKSIILRAQTETCMNCSSFLSEEEKSVLVIFITSLLYRNPETIEAGVKFLINENPEISFSRASNFTRLNLLPLGIDKSWDEKTIIRTALKNLEGMAFQVGVTEGDVFFTSDRPVIQYPSYNDNFPYTPKAVIFPLTSRIVLYLYPKEDVSQTAQNCLFQLDQERIRAIQHNVSVYARRWIYSRKPLTEEQVFIIKAAREKMPDL